MIYTYDIYIYIYIICIHIPYYPIHLRMFGRSLSPCFQGAILIWSMPPELVSKCNESLGSWSHGSHGILANRFGRKRTRMTRMTRTRRIGCDYCRNLPLSPAVLFGVLPNVDWPSLAKKGAERSQRGGSKLVIQYSLHVVNTPGPKSLYLAHVHPNEGCSMEFGRHFFVGNHSGSFNCRYRAIVCQ